jgi:hypothetical protein
MLSASCVGEISIVPWIWLLESGASKKSVPSHDRS